MKIFHRIFVCGVVGFIAFQAIADCTCRDFTCDPDQGCEIQQGWEDEIRQSKFYPDYDGFLSLGHFPFIECTPCWSRENMEGMILQGIAAAMPYPEITMSDLSSWFYHRGDAGIRAYFLEKKDILTTVFSKRLLELLDKENFGLTSFEVGIVQRIVQKHPAIAFLTPFGSLHASERLGCMVQKLFFGFLRYISNAPESLKGNELFEFVCEDGLNNSVDFLVAQLGALCSPFKWTSSCGIPCFRLDLMKYAVMKVWRKAIKQCFLYTGDSAFERASFLAQACAHVIFLNGGSIVETRRLGKMDQ